MRIAIPANGWKPRPYQMPAWLAWERGIKRSLLVWHRRAGKDEISLHKFAVASQLRVANYWHCLPMYEQARKAIWEAVNPHSGKRRIDEAFPNEIRKRTDNSSMVIEFKTGSVYRVVGSDNPDSLVGAPPLGIAFSEWALSNPSAWGLLQPILLENGGWADFITTPRGRNHVHGMYKMAKANPNWFCEVLTVDDTNQVSAEQIEEVRKEYVSLYGEDAADALIQQEYWCSFEAAILGAYYGKEMAKAEHEGRIGQFEPMLDFPVHTAWDLGASRSSASDSMAIWFWQAVPGDKGKTLIRVVDYLSGAGYSISHYAKIIKDRAELRGYERGTDFVPHDAKVPEMTSSGKDGKAKLRIEVMIECGLKPKVVADHKVADGISALRQIFPRLHFDGRCEEAGGLECLRQYQTEWDDELKVFKKTALANWAAHGADAARYMAIAFRDLRQEPVKERGRMFSMNPQTLPQGVQGVTLNHLWENRPKASRRI
jgi:phage terminase large subunit